MATRKKTAAKPVEKTTGSASLNAYPYRLGHERHADWALNKFDSSGRTTREVIRDQAREAARKAGKRIAEIQGPYNSPLDTVTVEARG